MIRIGVMGAGVIARFGHAPAILQTPGLVLASVYDPSQESLAEFARTHPGVEVETFQDRNAFFASGISAVSVCSSAPAHLSNVREAAAHGLPVLCEKPLAMTDADIAAMIGLMEGAHLPLVAAFCYRFAPVAQSIKHLVDAGAIGAVRSMRLIYNWNLHGKYSYENGERHENPYRVGRMLEGGPMVDCGVHQIDLARWWTGSEITDYTAHAAWVDEEFEAPSHMWLHMDHDNGCHTAVEMSFAYTHTAKEPISMFTYDIIGTDGILHYDREGWKFEMRNGTETVRMPGSSEKNFVGMYHAWARALRTGDFSGLPNGRDGMVATRTARTATEECIARHRSAHKLGKP
ncbi:MAG: Gfo/Idh/MocA family oxidoreductase [Akkermansiaceae bacterium]|nr:Gfo/Idh/MocA family oxidoreductase [Armatimonadota bacterium]